MERYVSITKHIMGMDVHFRFIYSFCFLASSLDKLSSYVPATLNTHQQFANISDEKFQLVTRKGVFPYEYITLLKKLDDRPLPPKKSVFTANSRALAFRMKTSNPPETYGQPSTFKESENMHRFT